MHSVARLALAFLFVAMVMGARTAAAQEPVDALVDRGFVAHWLVCGPFKSDVPGGILGALQTEAPVLGDADFMATASGIARIRPQHLMRIPTEEGGEAIWQQAGTPEGDLDLKPFFPASPEGIAYAAFYANATQTSAIFLDVQSPLGVRLWANGFPLKEYEARPFEEAGVTQVAVPMRPGLNLIVMEVPGADYEALARTLGMTTQQLTASAMANRPRLRKTSGFAISVQIRPALPLGKFYVVPDLEDAGTFSGRPGEERQDTWLTFYNPQESFTDPIDVIVSTPAAPLPDLIEVEPLDPESAFRVPVPVPLQASSGGEALSVSVRLHCGGAEAAFTDALAARSGTDQPGIVRVITGHTPEGGDGEGTEAERLAATRSQLLTWQEAAGYGFDLRHAADWYRPFVALDDMRDEMLTASQQGGATVRATYAPVDERIAGGPLLWRNFQLGMIMAREILSSAPPQHLSWDSPGIAPQTPQLLKHASLRGLISNADTAGLPPLAHMRDLGGESVYLRHKGEGPSPGSVAELQEMAAVQRRELLALGIPTDVLVVKNLVPPPEPFYRGSVASLARAFPRIVLNDGGAAAFLEEVQALDETVQQALPDATLYLNQGMPGDLLAWANLKATQARAARQLLDAEALASIASLHGADYPHGPMDLANRQLAFYSTTAALAAPANREDALDTLAGFREVAELSDDTARRSLDFIAGMIDTAGTVPVNQGSFESLVVFNPGDRSANLPITFPLTAGSSAALTLVDASGTTVPHVVGTYQRAPVLEFLADNVPSFGYKTYFFKQEGSPSNAVDGSDLQIENDMLALFVDPDTGAIASLIDKRSGRELRGGLLNQILFLTDDENKNEGGRELWTGPASAPLPKPTLITSEHTSFRSSILVTSAVQGGTLEQRYTLHAGQTWVACETKLLDVSLKNTAIFASFQTADMGRSLLFGERFGALTGARGQQDNTLRTHGSDYPGATVMYPAREWAAIAPSDYIQVGADGVVPWEPVIIVHGADPVLEKAARELQAALYARAIPALVQVDEPAKPDFLWTDGTFEMDTNDYLARGYRMRVVIGSPDQNAFSRVVLNQLSGDDASAFAERIQQGARLLMEDTRVPEGFAPVPTLILAGITPTQSAALTAGITKALRAGQPFLMPPSACLIRQPAEVPESGLAIAFPGSMGVSQQRDGRLLLGLAHETGLGHSASGARLSRLMGDLRFNYAIHPFEGDWRTADVPALAAQSNVRASVARTGIHPGSLPPSQSFLGLSGPGLRIDGLRPAGFPQAGNSREAFHPRNGYALLAWESLGQPWRGTLSSAGGFLEAGRADVADRPGAALPLADGQLPFEARPFEFQPLWLLPADQSRRDPLARLGREADPQGVIHTRYWEERRGGAPQQNLPLGVQFRGSLEGETPVLEVVVSNHLTDTPIEGMAILSASSDITFGPQQFFFSLAPGRQHVEPIEVAFARDEADERAMAVEASFERQTYRDVIMANDAPYSIVLSRNGAQLRVELKNESGIHAQGYLDLITSPNHWPEFQTFPEVTALPRRATVSVPPYKAQTIIFTLSDPEAALEACVKLSANGRVRYEFFDAAPVAKEAPESGPANRAGEPSEEPAAQPSVPVPPPPRRR